MPDHDITCREVTRDTTAYLDGAMPPRLRTTFEQHLVFCPFCVAHLAQVRATSEIVASLGGTGPPAETTRAVLDTLGGRGG